MFFETQAATPESQGHWRSAQAKPGIVTFEWSDFTLFTNIISHYYHKNVTEHNYTILL